MTKITPKKKDRFPRLRKEVDMMLAKMNKKKENQVRKVVKKVLNRQLETKMSIKTRYLDVNTVNFLTRVVDAPPLEYIEQRGYYAYDLGIGAPNSPYSIAQGTDQGDRIGNSISVVKNVVHYSIQSKPQRWPGTITQDGPRQDPIGDGILYIPQPYTVLALCLRRHDNLAIDGINQFTDLFQYGNSLQAPLSEPMLLYQKLNKDKYEVIHRRIHKIQPVYGSFGDDTVQMSGLYQIMDSHHKTFSRGSFKIPTPSKLLYNDDLGGNAPTNVSKLNYFMVFLPIAEIDPNGFFAYPRNLDTERPEESEPFELINVDIDHHLYYKDN